MKTDYAQAKLNGMIPQLHFQYPKPMLIRSADTYLTNLNIITKLLSPKNMNHL